MMRHCYVLLFMLVSFTTSAVEHERLRIDWDSSTLRLVAAKAGYARIIRLPSRDLLCCYQRKGQSRVRRSTDHGDSWREEVTATHYQHGVAANPELLQLNDGRVLLYYNERPTEAGHPYSIMSASSVDEGRTWAAPERLFTGGLTWEEGCWEPAAIQYPDGEVQVFFANEKPYANSNEQEISMISSRVPGRVWTVSRRDHARDGMPVPCLLKDGQSVVLAIEDSKWRDHSGRMKPVILCSTLEQCWKKGRISGSDERRRHALKTELPPRTYLGAPYLVQMPSGVTVLSAQLENGAGVQQMMVYVGDENAREFTNGSKPFDMADNAPGKWNSLFVKSEQTVTAVSGTTIDGVYGVWTIDGRIRPRVGVHQ